MQRRPWGINVVIALLFVAAALNALFGLLSVFAYPLVARALWKVTVLGSHGPASLLTLGPALPLYFLAVTAFLLSLAIGLLQLRNWARLGTMTVLVIAFIISLMQLAFATQHARPRVLVEFVARVCVNAGLFLYLSRPAIRGLFRQNAPERRRRSSANSSYAA